MANRPEGLAQVRSDDLARATRALLPGGPASGRLVVVTGPAGIGKSWFVARLLEQLPAGLPAVVVAPPGHGECPPLRPWLRAARALARNLPAGPLAALLADGDPGVGLDPAGPGLPSPAAEQRAEQWAEQWAERLADAFAAEHSTGEHGAGEHGAGEHGAGEHGAGEHGAGQHGAGEHGTGEHGAGEHGTGQHGTGFVLLLDDVHRFDGPSLAVLDALCAPLTGPALPLVVSGRPGDSAGSVLLQVLAAQARATHVALGPLPRQAVAGLVAGHAPPAAAEPLREIVVRLSAGNPRTAVELAAALPAAGDEWSGAGRQALHGVVRELLSDLDDRGVLAALALTGRPATTSLLASAAQTPIAVARQVVDHAATAGLVTAVGPTALVDFGHHVIRDAVATAVAPDLARQLHYRLATLVAPGEPEGPAAVLRARHLLAAGDGSASTARACLLACTYLEKHGNPEEADELARVGLDVTEAAAETRVGLLRARARLLGRAAAWAASRKVAQAAVTLAEPLPERAAFVHAVADLTTVDPQVVHVEPDRRRLVEAALAEPACTGPVRAVLLARLSDCWLLDGPDDARRLAEEALELAAEVQDEVAADAATIAWLHTHFTLDAADETAALARRLVGRGVRPAPAMTLAPALSRGDRGVVEVVVEQLERDLARAPHVRSQGIADLVRLGLAICDGDAAAVDRHATALAACPTAELAALAMPLLAVWTGLSGRTVPLPVPFEFLAPPTSELGRLVMLAVAASAVHNDRSIGTEHVVALLEPRETLLERRPDCLGDIATALAALAGSAAGDRELCESAAVRLAGHEDRFVLMGAIVVVAPAGWLAAWAHTGRGDLPAALAANDRATAACRRARFDTWTAQCLLQRAELLTATDPTSAAAAADAALGLALQHGLSSVADRARPIAEVSARGSSPLSPAQQQVLALAAAGCTNDQIARRLGCAVSTVEKHLTAVYRRLGVPNRAAAVRWSMTNRLR